MNVVNDMHPEDIKAAIRKRGKTLRRLALDNGFGPQATQQAIRRPWPNVEYVIAEFLGMKPQEIWPSRYRPDGTSIAGRPMNRRRLEIVNRVHEAVARL